MKLSHVESYYRDLAKDSLSFIYQGIFTDDITGKIIELSENAVDSNAELTKLRNKISFMIVECFQNIVRHGSDTRSVKRSQGLPGLFFTRNIGSAIYISSANLIENKHVAALQEKLNKINSLNKDEIKALYLEMMSSTELSSKGGAGLGLIEMARKSGQPIEFAFENVNDKISFFYMMVKMTKEEKTPTDIEIAKVATIHHGMINDTIVMLYKGVFEHATLMSVLKMIEDNINIQLQDFAVKKKLYHILVEALQNIYVHGKGKGSLHDSIFMIGRNEKHFTVATGNTVDNTQIEKLTSTLNMLNALSKTELDSLYTQTLRNGEASEKGAGLGLIDIAREASNKLAFEFKPLTETESLFSLLIEV